MESFPPRYHLQLFFFAVALESLAANFTHPITLTPIRNLQLPNYSFGMLYAGMTFTSFLFSPFWAEQVTRMGSRRVLGICCVGYGIEQLLSTIMKILPTIMFTRLLSGFFVGGIVVNFLTYIIHTNTMESRGRYLALSVTLTTVFAAFGYPVGGFAGVVSIPLTFTLQSGVLILCGMLFAICLRGDKEVTGKSVSIWKEANPFQTFLDVRRFMTLAFAALFFAVFLTSTAATACDQNFNYFIKDRFRFDFSYNGMLKAVIGFISLFANTTVCVWIMKRTSVKKSVIYVLGGVGVTLIAITMLKDILPSILINIIFFALDAIYIPLLQDLCASASSAEHSSMVMGFYNAMRSLGTIAGVLFAGFICTAGPWLSLLYAGIFSLISMLAAIRYHRYSGRNRESVQQQKNNQVKGERAIVVFKREWREQIVLLIVDTQTMIMNEALYKFQLLESHIKTLIAQARRHGVEMMYVRHDGGAENTLTKGAQGLDIYDESKSLYGEKTVDKNVNNAFKDIGLTEYLRDKGEDTIMITGLQTEYCINTTIVCGFEYGFHMIVPAYTSSTVDNDYMSVKKTYDYYNNFIWKNRYASCVPFERASEMIEQNMLCR